MITEIYLLGLVLTAIIAEVNLIVYASRSLKAITKRKG